MPTSRHHAKHKQKAKARTVQIQARRENTKKLVGQLEQEFAKLQPEAGHRLDTVVTPGVYLTPTPDEYEINEKYDNLEI